MATYEYIFIGADQKPADVAAQLSAVLEVRVTADAEVIVGRPARDGRPGRVGGELGPNIYADPDPEPREESVIDGYELVWSIGYTDRKYDVQLAEARALFAELTGKVPWPLLLVHGFDTLVAAWRPEVGLREFPPATTPGAKDRYLWEPYHRR